MQGNSIHCLEGDPERGAGLAAAMIRVPEQISPVGCDPSRVTIFEPLLTTSP